jgi:hypothetical protein
MLVYTDEKNKKYYMNHEGAFTDNLRAALPVECIPVVAKNLHNTQLYRIKCFNKYYLTSDSKNLRMEQIPSDKNIVFDSLNHSEISFFNSIISITKDMKISVNQYNEDDSIMKAKSHYLREFKDIPRTFKITNWIETPLEHLFINGFTSIDLNLTGTSEFERARSIINSSPDKRVHNLIKIDVCFQRLLTHPKIKKFINEIYENNPWHLTTYSSNRTNKTYKTLGWHVDYPYHDIKEAKYPIETRGIQMIITLDDFTEENGATEVIKGSHALRSYPTSENMKGMDSYKRKIIVKKGSVVFWLGKLWHREGKSKVVEHRSALLANFSPISVPAKNPVYKDLTFVNQGLYVVDNKVMFS